jgi:hypothetical protein
VGKNKKMKEKTLIMDQHSYVARGTWNCGWEVRKQLLLEPKYGRSNRYVFRENFLLCSFKEWIRDFHYSSSLLKLLRWSLISIISPWTGPCTWISLLRAWC